MRLVTGITAALVAALLPGVVSASPISARLSPQGLKFVEDQVKALVPSSIDLPPLVISLSDTCSAPSTLTQEDTKIQVQLKSFTLSTLPGVLRADVVLSMSASGTARIDNALCFLDETCGETISLQDAHLAIDMAASIDGAGKPHVAFMSSKIDIDYQKLNIALVPLSAHGCPEAGLFNTLLGVIEKYAVELGRLVGQSLVEKLLGPKVEEVLANYLTFKGNAAFLGYKAALTGLDFAATGITINGDVDLTSLFPAASCLKKDPGEPMAIAGAVPDLSAGTTTDVSLAVNLGVVQDVIYHVWHEGLFCITPDTLATLKVDLSALEQLGNILPGFPAGTKWVVEAYVGTPPVVEGSPASAAKLAVHANEVSLDVIASLPDKSTKRMHVDLDATVTASVVIDPGSNALALQVDGATIDRMQIEDHLGLAAAGISVGNIQKLLEDKVLPGALGGIGQIPITGPVFGGLADTYVILKELKTTPAYLMVKANLFHAPAGDTEAPTTQIVSKPTKLVKPSDAKLVFGGTDKQIPTELLKYRISVDGKLSDPTFVRTLTVGTSGKSGTVHVEVHAIDLAGNEDRVGATADVEVDGVSPALVVTDALRSTINDLTPTVHFVATDDRTAAAAVVTHVAVTEQGGSGRQVMDEDLTAGAKEATLSGLAAGHTYQALLTARDEAGNQAVAQMIFAVSSDASSGGGCAVEHGAGGLVSLLLVGAALAGARRRR